MKFLPQELEQVKYKILWLYSLKNCFFVFLDERSKNGNFEWLLAEKWPWSLRGLNDNFEQWPI